LPTAFVYSDGYLDYDYGPTHPLKIIRLKLAYDLIQAYGLLSHPSVALLTARKAEDEDLALFHSREYLAALIDASLGRIHDAYPFGLGPGDNPVFKGLYDWSLLVAGATLQACDFVGEGKGSIAFNMAGGLHHAQRSKASGFCYVNDPVLGILRLLEKGKRVAYIDIDAHHGDGVQAAFYESERVLTISLHQTGQTLYPGTGFEDEIGAGKGEGYSVNVPLPPFTDDETYLWAFDEVVPPLIDRFEPDVLVTQLGVDTFYDDPLAKLNLTLSGYEKIIRRMKTLAPRWVALGGGGYDVVNVARAWTLVWAVMNGVEISNALPEEYIGKEARLGIHEKELKGRSSPPRYGQMEAVRRETERVVDYVKKAIFPKVRNRI
jgi:acetoin utilization protein AcuC